MHIHNGYTLQVNDKEIRKGGMTALLGQIITLSFRCTHWGTFEI